MTRFVELYFNFPYTFNTASKDGASPNVMLDITV